jgi:hypothetical protein
MPRTNNHHIELFRKAHTSILGCPAHFLYNPSSDKQQSAMRSPSFALSAALLGASIHLPLQAQQLPTDITTVHLTTDHSYSDQRIALEKAVLEALEYLQHK